MSYFKRIIDEQLQEWKDSPFRKPLLVRGARQIGKSSSIRQFGQGFKYFIEVNFETRKDIVNLFNLEHDVNVLAQRLGMLYATPVIPGETLLFFDEIQCSPEALKSLWFFKENHPELHVIAAGSLLEFALEDMHSYGVGRVSSIFMYPLAFKEFLWALGKEEWVKAINEADHDRPLFDALHNDLVSTYRTFLMVGGMPASVRAWVTTKNFQLCINELSDIQQTYYDDFQKYGKKISPELLRATLQSVVAQTGGKFVYSKVAGAYSIEDVKKALSLLTRAGLVKPVRHSAANGLPLGAEVNEKFTKYLYLDTGLLLRILDLDFGGADDITEMILAGAEQNLVNKGGMAELSVGWEMIKGADFRHSYNLYYWENMTKGASSEVDFVIPRNMKILPVEVKSGTGGKMKSLRWFMDKKHLSSAVRTSLENFSRLIIDSAEGQLDISIIPIYAISRLTQPHNLTTI